MLSLLFCIFFQSAAQSSDTNALDPDLVALVASISTVQDGTGIDEAGQILAARLQAYKAKAIPYLLPLLESKEARIRNFAGYVLRDLEGLTEEHLPALIAAQRRGNGWISPALGRMRTPEAIQTLVATLKSSPESDTQVTYALGLAGEPAVPYLVALLDSPVEASQNLFGPLCQIFSTINSEVSLDLLLKIANDKKVGRANRLLAISNIGCVQLRARRVIPALQKLAAEEPGNFGPAINAAISNIQSPESVPYLVNELRSNPGMTGFREIAALHEDGNAAGPVLVEFLSNADPDIRVGAARSLGFVGYEPAAEHLLFLLKDQDDWRLAYVAAESLGRLRARKAIPALKELALTHWYPPVAGAADFAIKVIEGKDAYAVPGSRRNFPLEFSAFTRAGETHGNSPKYPSRPATVNGPEILTSETLAEITDSIETQELDQQGKKNPRWTISLSCGLKTADGYIVGRDRGEWGGELAYVTKQFSIATLLNINTNGIYRLPFGILAVTGLAHLGMNDGALVLLVPVEGGGYRTKRWKTLPGGPISSGMLANGNLFISTVGGDVVITPEGRMEMASANNTSGT